MPDVTRTRPSYKIDLPAFTGPLDLLLHLIEREELDITAISLARVTAQYLAQVEGMKQDRIEHLIDFLVIGARLVQIKSRALLPQPPAGMPGEEEEEDPAEALIRQLRVYKRFKSAAHWLQSRDEAGLRTYLRVAPPPKLESKLDMSGITVQTLIDAMHAVLDRAETMGESVEVVEPPRITIEGQIKQLRVRLSSGRQYLFDELMSEKVDRVEVAITLLAVLELIKRREVLARQPHPFGPIEIRAATTATAPTPATPPANQSPRP